MDECQGIEWGRRVFALGVEKFGHDTLDLGLFPCGPISAGPKFDVRAGSLDSLRLRSRGSVARDVPVQQISDWFGRAYCVK